MILPFFYKGVRNLSLSIIIRTINKTGRDEDGKTTLELLANLEHEFRFFWYSIRVGFADGQHERDI